MQDGSRGSCGLSKPMSLHHCSGVTLSVVTRLTTIDRYTSDEYFPPTSNSLLTLAYSQVQAQKMRMPPRDVFASPHICISTHACALDW
jgi:hypothetical protein